MWRKSGHKFGAKKSTDSAGRSFGSKLELSVFEILLARQFEEEIKIVRQQASVYLTDARILYKPDFECIDLRNGHTFFVEAKGFETPEWRIKLRLYRHYGPYPLEVYKGSHAKPFLDEVVIPIVKTQPPQIQTQV